MPTIVGSKSGSRPYLEADWMVTEQDVARNRSKISVTLYLKVDSSSISYTNNKSGKVTVHGQEASFSGPGNRITSSGRYKLTTKTFWVSHTSDGTRTTTIKASYNIAITWSGSYVSSISLSGSATLPKIARASSLQIKNKSGTRISSATIGDQIRFALDIPTGLKVTLGLDFDGGKTITTTTSNSYDWTIPTSYISKITTSSNQRVRFWAKTYSGTNYIGVSYANLNLKIPNSIVPSIGDLILTDTTNKALAGFLKGVSTLRSTTTASGNQGSTIKNYSWDIGDQSLSGQTVTSPLNKAGSISVKVTVTDSRGRTATKSTTLTVLNYHPPKISYFIPVRTGAGTNTTVIATVIANVADVPGNTLAIKIEYKKRGTTTWTRSYESTSSSMNYNQRVTAGTNIEVTSGYDFRLTVSDKLQSSRSLQSISTARTAMSWGTRGIGVGMITTNNYDLEVGSGGIFSEGSITSDSIQIGNNRFSELSSGALNISANGDFYLRGNRIMLTSDSIRQWNGSGSSVPLIESGSNSNGDWIKFYDGTAINIIKLTVSSNDNYVGLPLSYINADYSIFINAQESSKQSSRIQTATNNIGAAPNHNYQLRLLRFGTSNNVDITITTIGRWK